MKKIILKGPRLTLRPVKLVDAPNFVRWFKDPEVARYIFPKLFRMSLFESKKYIKKALTHDDRLVYLIKAEDGNLVGITAVRLHSSDFIANFEIIIGEKEYWGRGYAGECIKLIGDFVFKKLKYNRFELLVFVENKRAVKAYRKAGFKMEGQIRAKRLSRVDKKFHDEYMMSILRSEWLKKKK